MPRRERTLVALLESLSATYTPAKVPAAFLFRNAFFYVLWEVKTKISVIFSVTMALIEYTHEHYRRIFQDDPQAPAQLLTACKTRRWTTPHVLKNRSKYVVRPRHAVELGNHFTWELLPGATSVGVPKDLALLHHYRVRLVIKLTLIYIFNYQVYPLREYPYSIPIIFIKCIKQNNSVLHN